ncbi:hypothetical protein [Psychromarinibacter sp. S121]
MKKAPRNHLFGDAGAAALGAFASHRSALQQHATCRVGRVN